MSGPDAKQSAMPVPLTQWERTHGWPTSNSWYNMLRPNTESREKLIKAGAVRRVNGVWLIFPDAWLKYCENA